MARHSSQHAHELIRAGARLWFIPARTDAIRPSDLSRTPSAQGSGAGRDLTKLLSVFVILAMIIQIIKPIGLPGLRKRADFWKLPLAGFVVIVVISTLQF
jgi:hypothetical protein